MAEWITDRLPVEGEVVVARFAGHWPGRGNCGVTDLYQWGGEWFNVPAGVTVTGWIPMPKEARRG